MKRLEYIDLAKGVMILLVVIGHLNDFYVSGSVHDKLFTFIYSFHMCLFFLLSGFVMALTKHRLRELSYKKWLWKKVQTLFVPFLAWTFIMWRFVDPIINFPLDSNTIQFIFLRPDTGTWFFLSLFVCQVVCYPIFRFKPIWSWLFPIGFLLIGHLFLARIFDASVAFAYYDIYHFSSFMAGYLYYEYRDKLLSADLATISLIAFVVVEITHPNPILATLSFGITLLYICQQYAQRVEVGGAKPWLYNQLKLIGCNTMAIYPIQSYFIHSFSEPVLILNNVPNTVVFTIMLVLSYFVSIACIYIARVISYFPIIDRLLLGKVKQ